MNKNNAQRNTFRAIQTSTVQHFVAFSMPFSIILLLTTFAFFAVHGQRYPVTLAPNSGLPPQVTVQVGTPPQTVTVFFDSGSSLFWTAGEDRDCKDGVQYNPNASSTAEPGSGGDVSFSYITGSISGPSNTDLTGFNAATMFRTNVTSATTVTYPLNVCEIYGIIGMDQASQFMASYFENQGTDDNEKYFVANFNNAGESPEASWFEISDSDDDDGSSESSHNLFDDSSKCIALLPEEARLIPQNITSSYWWQFEVTKFIIGDNESTGRTQAIFDSGTFSVLGNFVSIFSPDPVPENLCEYMYKNNVTLDVEFSSQDSGNLGVYSMGWDDMFYSDGSGEPCEIVHDTELPETLVILGIPYYNKLLIKHDYNGQGQVCAIAKPGGYDKAWQSSSLPSFTSSSGPSSMGKIANSNDFFVVLVSTLVAILATIGAWI